MSLGRKAPIAAAIVAGLLPAGSQIGYAKVSSSAVDSVTTPYIPLDMTIPQVTEGKEFSALTLTYAPKRADSLLEIELTAPITSGTTGNYPILAIFKNGAADAIYAAPSDTMAGGNYFAQQKVRFTISAGGTSAQVFTVRFGGQSGTTYFNSNDASSVYLGTAKCATFTIKEISTVDISVGGFPASYSTIVTPWVSEPLTITGTTTNPTKGTIVNDKIWWRRNGDSMECRIDYQQSVAGMAGSGEYRFGIPGGYSIDTAKARIYTGTSVLVAAIGYGMSSDLATYTRNTYLNPHSATLLRMGDTTVGYVGSGNMSLANTQCSYVANFTIPIVGWS